MKAHIKFAVILLGPILGLQYPDKLRPQDEPELEPALKVKVTLISEASAPVSKSQAAHA